MSVEQMGLTARQAEQFILGAMLLQPKQTIHLIEDHVDPKDFWEPKHETLYNRIIAIYRSGSMPDAVIVQDELMRHGELQAVGQTYCHELMATVPDAWALDRYVEIIKASAIRRRLREVGTRIVHETDNPEWDPRELVERARAEIDKTTGSESYKLASIGESLDETLDSLGRPSPSTPSPWPSINDLIGGVRPGQLIVIGARPSVGKTVTGMQLAMSMAVKGAVSYHSLEMTKGELNRRIISAMARVDLTHLISGQLNDRERDSINRIRPAFQRMMMYVDDRSTVGLNDIRRYARSVSRTGYPMQGIVVDYLQLISQQGDRRPRHEFVSELSRGLKVLAKEMEVPVIALSQLNRNSAGSDDQFPRLSELRESGSIEQDADVVMLMHRKLVGEEKNDLAISVAKNRNGPTGTVAMQFWGHYSTIEDTGGGM